jgi:hypothetical protein
VPPFAAEEDLLQALQGLHARMAIRAYLLSPDCQLLQDEEVRQYLQQDASDADLDNLLKLGGGLSATRGRLGRLNDMEQFAFQSMSELVQCCQQRADVDAYLNQQCPLLSEVHPRPVSPASTDSLVWESGAGAVTLERLHALEADPNHPVFDSVMELARALKDRDQAAELEAERLEVERLEAERLERLEAVRLEGLEAERLKGLEAERLKIEELDASRGMGCCFKQSTPFAA